MTNGQKDLIHLSIEQTHDALQRLVEGHDPTAASLSDRRDYACWELNYLLSHLIPSLPSDLQAEVQACYDLREYIWGEEYRHAYSTQQKTSPECLAASDSL